MQLYRKVLIVAIFILCVIIVYRFLQNRWEFLQTMNTPTLDQAALESFSIMGTPANGKQEAEAIKSNFESSSVTILPVIDMDFPICQYFIKSSANSAYSGGYVSTDMLKIVIMRGVRFLDFQLFGSKDDKTSKYTAVVGVNINNGQTVSQNQIPFADVLKTILIEGMNNAPNAKDPLFIQLRVNIADSANIYEPISMDIQNTLGGSSYVYTKDKGTITSKTLLSELLSKIVFAIDISSAKDYKNPDHYKTATNNLTKYVTMETNTIDIPSYDYNLALTNIQTPIFVQSSDKPMTNISHFTVISPSKDDTKTNPVFKDYVKKYGYNTLLYQYNLTDSKNMGYLQQYEAIFGANTGTYESTNFNTAFVSMAKLLAWMKKNP
jgi:hypothetical protein